MKKFDLFTTSGWVLEQTRDSAVQCCDVCTSPFIKLCKPFCKYRNATVKEFLADQWGLK